MESHSLLASFVYKKDIQGASNENAIASLNYKNVTVNHAPPHVGERGKFLWIAQKHTRNTSCILSTVSAKSSYAMPLSTHGAIGTGGGKEKYPLNTSQKKSFIL